MTKCEAEEKMEKLYKTRDELKILLDLVEDEILKCDAIIQEEIK
jgi:hypothetical protein